MTHMLRLLNRWESVEKRLVVDAVAHEIVDRQVTHAHGGEVLEKVGALARFHTEIAQTSLDNDFGCRDIGPLDGNT